MSQQKDRPLVAVLANNRIQIGDIANLDELMQQTGFADVRYFRFATGDKTRLSEIRHQRSVFLSVFAIAR